MAGRFNDLFNNPDSAFDDVISRTRDAAEAFGKKSAERLEISKKKLEYIDMKAKLNKLFEKYGRLHYAIHLGDIIDEQELSDIEIEIAQLKEKMELLAVDIDAAKAKFNEVISSAAQMAYDVIQKEKEKATATEVDIAADDITEE